MDEIFEDMVNTAESYYQRREKLDRQDRQENWRVGYDVLTEGALGDYPEE